MADVFISYSRTRVALTDKLAKELANLGYDVWWDASLLPMDAFGPRITAEIDQAKAVIVVWSAEAAQSDWVRAEAGRGARQNKLINCHASDVSDPYGVIPMPHNEVHSVCIDDTRAIVAALQRRGINPSRRPGEGRIESNLDYPPSRGGAAQPPEVRGDGRIKLDAPLAHGTTDGWFMPGAGRTEWFQDFERGPEMVVVPAGSFTMGSAEEGPARVVTIRQPFAIGRYPVTVEQWRAVRSAPATSLAGDFPVTGVNWHDAEGYCRSIGHKTGRRYRLPTEAEWEYCCRAGSQGHFWWEGRDEAPPSDFHTASQPATGRSGPTAALSGSANPWGLHHTHGNVKEWVQDNWHSSYRRGEPPTDGSTWNGGDSARKVVRGGSWKEPADLCRSWARMFRDIDDASDSIGFRVVREL